MKPLPAFLLALGVLSCLGCSENIASPTSSTPPPSPPTASPPPAPEPPPDPEPTPEPSPRTLRTASFEGANGYQTVGTASIVQEGNSHRLELGNDFGTDNSPALDVRLCRGDSCDGGDLNLGPLKRFSGRQSYDMPNAGAAYSHVVIWCRAVQLPFGSGRLR